MTLPRWCPRCQTLKTSDDFYNWKSGNGGKATRCIPCMKEIKQRSREKRRSLRRARNTTNDDSAELGLTIPASTIADVERNASPALAPWDVTECRDHPGELVQRGRPPERRL